MHLIGSYGLMYFQVPEMVSNLFFSYDGRNFIPPSPALRFSSLKGVGKELTFENRGKKVVE